MRIEIFHIILIILLIILLWCSFSYYNESFCSLGQFNLLNNNCACTKHIYPSENINEPFYTYQVPQWNSSLILLSCCILIIILYFFSPLIMIICLIISCLFLFRSLFY